MKGQFINNSIINEYASYLKQEEKATATIEKYIRDIKAFKEYISENSLSKEIAIEYKQFLIQSGYALRSINSVIASLNGLFIYMNRLDCKLKAIKIQRDVYCSEEKELTKAEYKRLLCTAKAKGNERLNLVLQTICGTGIRVSELKFFTVEAVKKGRVTVTLKGKTRTVFIVKELQKKLLNYCKERNLKDGCVFRTRTGRPLNRTNVWKDMKALCKDSGVNPNKVFPHNLRHLFARTFYGIERDIAKLADILGHSCIDTTRIYIITTGEEHRRRMEKMKLII